MPKIVAPKYCLHYLLFMLFALVLHQSSLYAQRAKKIVRKADASFASKNYYQAAKLYEAVLYDSPLVKSTNKMVYPYLPVRGKGKIKPTERTRAVYQLAESYRLHDNYQAAMLQYKTYLGFKDSRYPLANLWYGSMLLASGDPQNAKIAFTSYLDNNKQEDQYTEIAKTGLASSLFAMKAVNESPVATVQKTNSTSSADGSNFAFEKYNDSNFLFTSSRHELRGKQKSYPVRLYSGNDFSTIVQKLAIEIPDDLNIGASSLSADGLTMYFTGWKSQEGKPDQYNIYYTQRPSQLAKWGKPVVLPEPVNQRGARSKQPFITPDGQFLFYASDQAGTNGGFDIWMIKMNGVEPNGNPINAGININTKNDEVSPYYDGTDSTLYFSSDGRIGIGGMDIFKSKGLPDVGEWSLAVNLGMPINSPKNDLYYRNYKSSDTLSFSSDRNSSCCLEIFNGLLIPYQPKVDSVKHLVDTILNTKRIEIPLNDTVVPVTLLDTIKQETDSISAVTAARYNINYHFASAKIRKVDIPVLEQMVKQLKENPTLNILVASFTDCIGSREANVNMSKKRSASVKAYLIKRGIAADRINTDFFAKRYFLMACKEDATYDKAAQIANRRSDLILTTEKHPTWKPSGNEIDVDGESDNNQIQNSKPVTSVPDISNANITKPVVEAKSASVLKNKKSTKDKAKVPTNNTSVDKSSEKGGFNLKKQAPVNDNKLSKGTTALKNANNANRKLEQKIDIGELLEFVPKVKESNLVDEMKMRIPSKPLFVYTKSDSVRIDLYDNGSFDYDTLSVIYNKEIVVYKQLLLTRKPVTFYVKLDTDQSKNEMIFFAESLGITPPNSALMVITDGDNKRTEVNISSDFNTNTVVYFIKVNK